MPLIVAPPSEKKNRSDIETQALQAMDLNKSDIVDNNAFLTIASPTNAQLSAQVKALTRQSTRQAKELNGLIRLVLNKLDATD